MNLEALVFDFDGIIVNSEPVHFEAYQRVLKPRGLGFSWAEYEQNYMGLDDRDAFRRYFERIGQPADAAAVAAIITEKALAFQALAVHAQPFPGVVELARAASCRIKVALCSGAMRSDIIPVVTRLGLLEHLLTVVTADDVARSKPDPTCYRMTLDRIGARDPSRCVAIEDTPAGIAAARGAGMRVVAVTNSHEAAKLQDADARIASLGNLALRDLAALVGLSVAD